jgi:hypothetical protein
LVERYGEKKIRVLRYLLRLLVRGNEEEDAKPKTFSGITGINYSEECSNYIT